MATLSKTYRFRMEPTRDQKEGLFRLAGARRFVWNWALARKKDHYKEHKKSLSTFSISAELTELKKRPEFSWLKDADSQSLQQTLRDLDKAFINFFEKRAKYPKFKSRKRSVPTFRIPQRVKFINGKVYVPKIGFVKIIQSQTIEGETKSATFKRDILGHWYVTVVVKFEMPDIDIPIPDAGKTVGLDLGLKDFVVTSDADRIETPKFYRKSQKKLRKAQRAFSRCQDGSRRKAKAKLKAAKIHRKTANQRKDFLHKLSTDLIDKHYAVCIEDLNVKGLARTKLAKSFTDASMGEFRRMLTYKALWNRKTVVVIDRFFPSSKMCRHCGLINEKLMLAGRSWTCECGCIHDRDLSAAINIKEEGIRILAAGHADRLNARGVDVRPATAGC